MAGFVKEVTPRLQAIDYISEAMSFPWRFIVMDLLLVDSVGMRLSDTLHADLPYPPYTRSLRDGYAVQSADVIASTPSTPTFLKKVGDIKMGTVPDLCLSSGEAAAIPTGGVLPDGSDTVVMLEDTDLVSGWVEVRKNTQSGENVIAKGEELTKGAEILKQGSLVDFRTVSLLATVGKSRVSVQDIRISIISTGDEIVTVDTSPLPPGCIRDVNGIAIKTILDKYGFPAKYCGIICDDGDAFEQRVREEMEKCDVLILSGGSSVGTRDHCSRVLESLPSPGLLIRGINIVPGKPTLVAGCLESKKLVISLPGHPLSCLTAAYVMLLPLLLKISGSPDDKFIHKIFMELAGDINAKTGPEEFTPCRITADGRVLPLSAKSGYISVLAAADGMIRMPENRETARTGERVEVWLW